MSCRANKLPITVDDVKFLVEPDELKPDGWYMSYRDVSLGELLPYYISEDPAIHRDKLILAIENVTGCAVNRDTLNQSYQTGILYGRVDCDEE